MNFKKVIFILLVLLPGLTHPASMLDWKKFVNKRNALYFSVASGCALALWKLTRCVPETPQAPSKELTDDQIDHYLRLLNFNPNSQVAQQFRADVDELAKKAKEDPVVVAADSKPAIVDSPKALSPSAKVEVEPIALSPVAPKPAALQTVSARGASAGEQAQLSDGEKDVKRGLDEAAFAKGISESQTFEHVEIPVTTQAICELEEAILRSLESNIKLVQNIKGFNERIKYFQDNLGKLSGGPEVRRVYADKLNRMHSMLNDSKLPWVQGREIALVVFGDPKLIKESLEVIKKDTHNHEQAISELMWYFYFIAEQRGEGFREGTFSIEDPDMALFNFICRHTGAYKRISSHYKADEAQHYGLDIHLELPNGKHHILFGHRPNGHTFVKLESHGVKTWADFVNHGIEYGSSLVNKFIPGSDDREDMKKERVPADIAAVWKKLIHAFFNNHERAQYIKEGEKGIGRMCQLLKNPEFTSSFINSDGSIEQDSKLIEFVECLSKYERSLKDSLVLVARTGREVIILRKNIK